uniref:Pyridine nucleotide-disulfide oxidoreductase domain-containing protein 1 n=1 Tax=Parascaris univalens TaxID=6257 RepID=A0A915BDT3_PARUN
MMRYVVAGGGVSALSCVEEIRTIDESANITLVTASPLLKIITNRQLIGQLTESFDVAEEEAGSAVQGLDVEVINDRVTGWHASDKRIVLKSGTIVEYDKLCIATGGRPKSKWHHPLIISIRDTETVDRLREKMAHAKRIVVVGNGGIATEVVYELKNIEIIWAIKHSSISATFFDEGAAEFFKPMLMDGHKPEAGGQPAISKRFKITIDKGSSTDGGDLIGCALGPQWASYADITGSLKKRSVHVIYNVEMDAVVSAEEACNAKQENLCEGEWPLFIRLNNGQIIGTDVLINATGVEPNSLLWKEQCDELALAPDQGILVDDHMMTSIPDVYACGDVCTAGWEWAKHWMQMRLWTQARQMGAYCGRAMALPEITLDFCFELFTHVTTFFGFKVIFLGRFNGENVEKPWHALIRITKDQEYVKLIIHDGRIQGAVLIGETELEDVIENLILNQIDITDQEDGLLDPNIDIGDYFD